METIALKDNDDRIGSVDAQNNLIYPGWDVFGKPILSRTTMHVKWISEKQFVCLPPKTDPDSIVVLTGSDGPVALLDIGADGDRDAEDASPDDPLPDIASEPAPEPPKTSKPKGKR